MMLFQIIWIATGICLLVWWLYRRFRK